MGFATSITVAIIFMAIIIIIIIIMALRYFMWEYWIKISFQRYFLTMKS